jgi:hypothetical protein
MKYKNKMKEIKKKKSKIIMKGYVPMGTHRDVDYFYSKSQEKFLGKIEDLTVGDLFTTKKEAERSIEPGDFPMLDMYQGIGKIKLTITI